MTTVNTVSNSKFVNETALKVQAKIEEQQAQLVQLEQSELVPETEVKKMRTKIKSNQSLLARLTVSKEAAKIIATHKIDIVSMLEEKCADTREAKKRLVQHLDAMSLNDPEKLSKCDFKLYSALFAEREQCKLDKALTLDKLKHVFEHDTHTQARYFANFAQHVKIAEVKRKEKNKIESVTVSSESALLKRIQAMFC